jgi:hypothetical protein
VPGLGAGKRKMCTSKQRKVIRFLRWPGQEVGGANLGIYINNGPTRCNRMQFIYFTAKNTLHGSGVSNTHHQEYIKL